MDYGKLAYLKSEEISKQLSSFSLLKCCLFSGQFFADGEIFSLGTLTANAAAEVNLHITLTAVSQADGALSLFFDGVLLKSWNLKTGSATYCAAATVNLEKNASAQFAVAATGSSGTEIFAMILAMGNNIQKVSSDPQFDSCQSDQKKILLVNDALVTVYGGSRFSFETVLATLPAAQKAAVCFPDSDSAEPMLWIFCLDKQNKLQGMPQGGSAALVRSDLQDFVLLPMDGAAGVHLFGVNTAGKVIWQQLGIQGNVLTLLESAVLNAGMQKAVRVFISYDDRQAFLTVQSSQKAKVFALYKN